MTAPGRSGGSGGDGRERRPARARRARRARRRGAVRSGGDAEDRPEPVSGLVGQVLRRLGIAEKVDRARAAADWERIAGPEIARRTGRARVRGRTLFVEVESAAWLQELNMMRHTLLRRLNEGREGARVEKIVFVQAGRGEGGPDGRTRRG